MVGITPQYTNPVHANQNQQSQMNRLSTFSENSSSLSISYSPRIAQSNLQRQSTALPEHQPSIFSDLSSRFLSIISSSNTARSNSQRQPTAPLEHQPSIFSDISSRSSISSSPSFIRSIPQPSAPPEI